MKMLMQGLSLPALTTCASSPLLPHRDAQPPPPPVDPFELDDTTGKAVVRFNPQTERQPPPPPPPDPVDEFSASAGANENMGATIQIASKSRTSEWRERKRQQVAAGNPGPTKKARRQYCCRVCGQVQSTG